MYKRQVQGGEQIFLAAVSDGQWAALCTEFAWPEWQRDPRLASNNLRVQSRDWLLPLLRQRFAAFPAAELARRFRHHACVGLNQRSFLLFELDPRRATSFGKDDCVIVFDPEGRKLSYHRGETIGV